MGKDSFHSRARVWIQKPQRKTMQRQVLTSTIRYVNKLSKVINESEWDLAEDKILMKMHRNYGRRWTAIGKYIQGR